jgi:hypothetical protein
MLIIFGLFWLNVATAEQRPMNGLYFIAGGIVVLLILATVLYRRGSRKIKVLRFGKWTEGTIAKLWQNVGYHPYASTIEPWKKTSSDGSDGRVESNDVVDHGDGRESIPRSSVQSARGWRGWPGARDQSETGPP